MIKNQKFILIFGSVALLAIFILIIYARLVINHAMEETLARYEQSQYSSPQDLRKLAARGANNDGVIENSVPLVLPTDPIIGARQPQLTIIEYGDFQCPYCADMAEVLDEILRTYPQVRLVWKDLPNPAHFEARPAALAARCAQAQDKFWEYYDLLFSSQEDLSQDLYIEIAEILGLDLAEFNSCLADNPFINLVGKGLDEANIYSVDATPYLFVGSQKINQLVSFKELSRVVEQELNKD